MSVRGDVQIATHRVGPSAAASTAGEPTSDPAAPPAAQPALAYRTNQRAWPWDVRVIVWMSVAWAGLQILIGALGAWQVLRDKNVNWFGSNFGGWVYLLGILLRSLLPSLLIIGLIGLLKFKSGARRLCVLCAGAFVVFAVVETVAQFGSMLSTRPHVYELSSYVLGVVQQFTSNYALVLVLCVVLARADVKLLADEK